MSAQPNLLHVPLSQLQLSIHNARKTGGTNITDLAASIEAHGLMQNLSVIPSANDPDLYDVIAGGRRLSALKLLQEQGRLDQHFLVPIRLIDNDAALEASTAENTIREAMHPADQFVAFKGMVDAHKSIEEVAAHFSVPVSVVKQRLKLANVHPKLVEIYRTGEMKLEQLQALALTDDHNLQLKAWNVKDDWMRRADQIRKVITKKEIGPDNPLVKFVDPDTYESAGGVVRRDMFSNDVYFSDGRLLETLARNMLDAITLREKNAGWSWVEAHLVLDYSDQYKYGQSTFSPRRELPTEEDAQRTKQISARLAVLSQLQRSDEEWTDTLDAEQDQLQQELELLQGKLEVWPAAAKAKTGVLIYIDQYQGLKISRGRLKPGQREGNGSAASKGNGGEGKSKKPTLSADMVQRLEMHRAAAIREHIAANHAGAMTLLLATMVTALMTPSGSQTDLDLNPRNSHGSADMAIRGKFSDLGKAPARKAIDDRIAQWKKDGMPGKAADLYAWIEKLSDVKRQELLALATALTLGTPTGARGDALAVRFGVDMAKWWSPTPATYLELVPKVLLAEAVIDVAGKPAGEAVLAMKKDGAMAEAAKRLAGTGWLPKPLRGADYGTKKTAAKAAPPATKPATVVKKGAAKKVAKPATKKPARKAAKSAPKKVAKKPAKAGA